MTSLPPTLVSTNVGFISKADMAQRMAHLRALESADEAPRASVIEVAAAIAAIATMPAAPVAAAPVISAETIAAMAPYPEVKGNRSGLSSLDRFAKHPGVSHIYVDDDGIWVELKRGWRNSYDDPIAPLHGIHEDSVSEVRARRSGIVPCTCEHCKGA